MRRLLTITVAGLLAATVAPRAADTDTATRWWSHVEALANDGMEGRNTGSAGHKRAAEYVAAQFQKAALEPAATNEGTHERSNAAEHLAPRQGAAAWLRRSSIRTREAADTSAGGVARPLLV